MLFYQGARLMLDRVQLEQRTQLPEPLPVSDINLTNQFGNLAEKYGGGRFSNGEKNRV